MLFRGVERLGIRKETEENDNSSIQGGLQKGNIEIIFVVITDRQCHPTSVNPSETYMFCAPSINRVNDVPLSSTLWTIDSR